VQQTLASIERDRKMDTDSLQAALILCSVDQGEVQAVIGDRFPGRAGFNRALDMRRPIGSTIKPAIYLNALGRSDRFNLLSLLDDSPISIPSEGKEWQPQNYDKTFHGLVVLRQALVHSINVATVRLGMELGLDSVIDTLHRLGISEKITPYPSLLLGAVDISPISILQMYQTIAAGGYRTPLRTILTVMDRNGRILQRYPLTVEQAARPAPVFCLTNTLQEVTRTGTAASLKHLLPPALTVAGKTGTTNDLRDSWFAGFSGSHVAVAWVGRDDNKSTGLTGASGALRVWAGLMNKIATRPLVPQPPDNIDFYYSDIDNGRLFADQCRQGTLIPFIRGGILPPVTPCMAPDPAQHPEQPATRPNNLERTLQQGIRQLLRIFQ
ncbi:MAG TPA: penicillin-binding protein 1B, partial [Desulfobulbaceae bacterium]|nr:penicillin-binding protein 1B [Desulfobulbaceae bacterium]